MNLKLSIDLPLGPPSRITPVSTKHCPIDTNTTCLSRWKVSTHKSKTQHSTARHNYGKGVGYMCPLPYSKTSVLHS